MDWQASDDLFLYVKTSAAAKAGGWNIRAGSLPSFKPEKVKDVEVGLKADFLDNRLRTNVALFHLWKSDNQATVSAVVPGIGVTQYIQNNGDARIWGAEFEVAATPWKGMELTASLSLMDGKYKAGSFQETQAVPSAVPLEGCVVGSATTQLCEVDLSELPLIQLPKRQFTIGATQQFRIQEGTLSITGNYAYIGSQYFNAVKAADQQSQAVKDQYAAETAYGRARGYGVFNARLAYGLDNPQIELAAFVRNIGNKKYLNRRYSDLYRQLGFVAEYPGEPRSWGLELTYEF